jgi:hypothetical protein
MATQHINASTFTTATPLVTSQRWSCTQYTSKHSQWSLSSNLCRRCFNYAHQVRRLVAPFLVHSANQVFYVNANDVIYGISAAASAAGAIVITYSA